MLLVLVIGIWGTIAYKILSAYSEDAPEIITPTIALNTDYKLEYVKDTFSIQPLERDPFLGTVYKPKAEPKPVVKTQRKVNKIEVRLSFIVRMLYFRLMNIA